MNPDTWLVQRAQLADQTLNEQTVFPAEVVGASSGWTVSSVFAKPRTLVTTTTTHRGFPRDWDDFFKACFAFFTVLYAIHMLEVLSRLASLMLSTAITVSLVLAPPLMDIYILSALFTLFAMIVVTAWNTLSPF